MYYNEWSAGYSIKRHQYYVSVKQWPDEYLPQYCSGVLILINVEVLLFCLNYCLMLYVQLARRMSLSIVDLGINFVLSFRVFDVITGLIAKSAKAELKHIPGLFPWLPVENVCEPTMVAFQGLKPLDSNTSILRLSPRMLFV